jgi:nitrilase
MSLVHPKYKAAVVQAAPVFLDLDGTVDKTIAYIEEAAAQGASLIAFPENWIPGYPWWIWLGTPAWAISRGFVQKYFDNALHYDSLQARRLEEAARVNRICVVLGHAERDGGTLYLGQWIIDANGQTVARRRKLRPTHGERTVFGEGDGSDLAVHDTSLGRVGALCCWENVLSLNKFAMYSQQEQVHIAAWPGFSTYEPFAPALGWEVNNAVSRVYAVEGGCFVLAPCSLISPEMFELLCDSPDKRELTHIGGGHAVIYGPDGRALCEKLPEDQEGLLYAEIDLGLISLAKSAMDPVGHYSRPDVTRLLFNNTRTRVVEHFVNPLAGKPDTSDFSGEDAHDLT